MIQNILAALCGGLVTFVTLWVWSVTDFTDETSAFVIASVLGALGYLLWPVVALLWARNRRQNRIDKEVEKAMAEQSKG